MEQITAEARQVRAGRLLVTLIAAVFYSMGWFAAKVFGAVIWCAVAVRVGWSEGRKAPGHDPAG
jgi:hypothetical protein